MTTTTHARLRRTAVEAVGSIPGIEAVVLYGSRARGTARAASDWDIAILSHAAPDDERAAERLFCHLDLVHPVVMHPESIEEHCNTGTRLEAVIARQGRLLAGDWTPPRCRTEDLDVEHEDLKRNLDAAIRDLQVAFFLLCDVAVKELLYVPKLVEESQQAAEALAKSIISADGATRHQVHQWRRTMWDCAATSQPLRTGGKTAGRSSQLSAWGMRGGRGGERTEARHSPSQASKRALMRS